MSKKYLYYKAINWNEIEDELDNATWERATSLFWLDTRIPIENDKEKWNNLSTEEQNLLNKSLILLTNLSTFQSIEVCEVIRNSARSQQEVAIFNNIQFTEMVNTKAYNKVLRVFNNNQNQVDELFTWVDNNEKVQKRLETVEAVYRTNDPIKKRFSALCVEGILVYSQLANLLSFWVEKKFVNLGEMIKMIILNESLHCIYLTHKITLLLETASEADAAHFRKWALEQTILTVNQEIELISITDLNNDLKNIAINLIKNEANTILSSLGIEEHFSVSESTLKNIYPVLNRIRKHDLTPQNVKQVKQVELEKVMSDDDYDF
jgi:ribonucleoside-diphosphate reductase beta chain